MADEVPTLTGVMFSIVAVIAIGFYFLAVTGAFASHPVPREIPVGIESNITIPYSIGGVFSPSMGTDFFETRGSGDYVVVVTTDHREDRVSLKYVKRGNVRTRDKFGSNSAPVDRSWPLLPWDGECVSDVNQDCTKTISLPKDLLDANLIIGLQGHGTGNITITRMST